MLGHKWEPAEGTVVQAETMQSKHHHRGAGAHPEHKYVIEVRKPNGDLIRGAVTEQSLFAHAVGTTVRVQVHSKDNEIRLDPNAGTAAAGAGGMSMADQIRSASSAFDGTAGAAGNVAALGGLGALGGPGVHISGPGIHVSGPGIHVIGPGGQEIQMNSAQGAEVAQLAQAMLSGDPAARKAAIDRLHQIKAQASGQAGTSGQPAAGFDQSASSFSFDQPTAPDPYGQAGPPAGSAFGAFGTGGGAGTAEQRIATLQQLLDKGILTESEFQAQRQQIINGI